MGAITDILDQARKIALVSRFKSLHWAKQICAISFLFFTLVATAIILADANSVALSVGATKPGLIAIPNAVLVSIAGAAILLFLASVVFLSQSAPQTQTKDVVAADSSQHYSRKLRVHVLLPIGPEGKSVGNGLLQAAGFLAAVEAFPNQIELLPFDHKNSPLAAAQELEHICSQALDGLEPICVICTMSDVCIAVAEKVYSILRRNPSLTNRLSVIFTVASAPDTPHDGKVLFQHFVRGDQEAEEIMKHCRAHRMHAQNTVQDALFLSMKSPYSRQTVEYLLARLVMEEQFRAQNISIDREGKFVGLGISDIQEWDKDSGEGSLVVAVAYDRALHGAIKALKDVQYRGQLVATSTLSVEDWQQYLIKRGYLDSGGFSLWHTYIEGFDPKNGAAHSFDGHLGRWDFEAVLNREEFYGKDVNTARSWFDELEQEVYKNIEANYISAFCFDAIRLFKLMHERSLTSLAALGLSSMKSRKESSGECPFEEIKFTQDGRTDVKISIRKI